MNNNYEWLKDIKKGDKIIIKKYWGKNIQGYMIDTIKSISIKTGVIKTQNDYSFYPDGSEKISGCSTVWNEILEYNEENIQEIKDFKLRANTKNLLEKAIKNIRELNQEDINNLYNILSNIKYTE